VKKFADNTIFFDQSSFPHIDIFISKSSKDIWLKQHRLQGIKYNKTDFIIETFCQYCNARDNV